MKFELTRYYEVCMHSTIVECKTQIFTQDIDIRSSIDRTYVWHMNISLDTVLVPKYYDPDTQDYVYYIFENVKIHHRIFQNFIIFMEDAFEL